MRREAYERLDIKREITVIPNFVDSNLFIPVEKEQNREKCDECGAIIHVSNFRPVKRVQDLIYAMSIVVKEEPDSKLLLVGDGPERHNVERLIERLTLHKNIKLTGFRSDVANLLQCSDIGVLCSETESAPLTLLEAMSTGLPVVATSVGGVPEIIKDGVNGFLVPPKNPEELASKILQLYEDQTLRNKIGAFARKTILKKYTSEKVVDQYLDTFKKII